LCAAQDPTVSGARESVADSRGHIREPRSSGAASQCESLSEGECLDPRIL